MTVWSILLLFSKVDIVLSQEKLRARNNDVSFTNFIHHENFELSGTPLKEIALKSSLDCLWKCNGETCCFSVNVKTKGNPHGLFECDLLGFDKFRYVANFTAAEGVDHYTLPIEYFSIYEDCEVINKTKENVQSGVFRIKTTPSRAVQVFCDMATSGGGWTVIQKRLNGSVDFYRGWNDYKKGFGNKLGEYWLGLDAIHDMTSQGRYRLRVDLEDFEGNTRYAEYETFIVAGESDKYRLRVGQYSGDAGDSLISWHNNRQFSTKDQDNDNDAGRNCAQTFTGAWWYHTCHSSNLNGLYLQGANSPYGKSVIWYSFKGHYYSLKRAEMKIRPK